MGTVQHTADTSGRLGPLWRGLAALAIAAAAAGCVSSWGNSPLKAPFGDPDEQPRRIETVQDFVGAERPG